MLRTTILVASWMAAAAAAADTVYRIVDPDGRITYSNEAPAGAKVDKTLSFANLPATPMPDAVMRYREELEKSMKKRLAENGKPRELTLPTIFTATWCGYCRQAKAYLGEKRIRYQEYDIDTPDGMRALIESGAGRGVVPVLVWKGRKIEGFSRTSYDSMLSGAQ